jgi:hypothetical protein
VTETGKRSPTIHELKTWTEFFDLVWSGRKTCEVRVDDRDYQAGDELHLRDYDRARGRYLERSIRLRITHVLRAPFVPAGLAVLSFRRSPHPFVELRRLLERVRDDPFEERLYVALATWCRAEGMSAAARALVAKDDEEREVPAPGRVWQEAITLLESLVATTARLEALGRGEEDERMKTRRSEK